SFYRSAGRIGWSAGAGLRNAGPRSYPDEGGATGEALGLRIVTRPYRPVCGEDPGDPRWPAAEPPASRAEGRDFDAPRRRRRAALGSERGEAGAPTDGQGPVLPRAPRPETPAHGNDGGPGARSVDT